MKLIDVYPENYPDPDDASHGNKRILDAPPLHMGGYQQLLRGEPFRAKFRNSWEKPEPLTPGKETEIDFTMPDLFHTFRRGHRIMVQVRKFLVPADGSQSADLHRHSERPAGGFSEGHRAGVPPEGCGVAELKCWCCQHRKFRQLRIPTLATRISTSQERGTHRLANS